MTLFRPRETAAGAPDFGLRGRLERLFPRSLVAAAGDALPPTIYGFILRHSRREQIYLVVVTLLSFPFLYYSLELPKVIINQAIAGKNFPWTILGIEFDRFAYLVLLCLVFLVFVLINGWFKYHLNVRKGRVGERMLRRLRYDLFERLLRFPMRHFDRTAAGEIIAMLTAELEPVGGFIGDAFALPIAQAGTLLTIFVIMFVQNPLLGASAVALYPVQAFFIPRMQRRIRALGRLRVRKVRTLSDRIGESIAAQVEIRTNAGAQHQLADISHRLGEIYDIRFDIYNRKFFVKFINNLINQLTPFFFYLIGGYFVITGELSFGALVAVLAAYKELSSPWKELLDFYQNQQDVAIKYEQVVEQFHVADMLDPRLLFDEGRAIEPPQGEVELTNVSLVDSDGIRLLDGLNLAFPFGTHVALVGPSNGGKNLVPQLLARLDMPSGGQITLGGVDLASLSFAASGRLIGYVGPRLTSSPPAFARTCCSGCATAPTIAALPMTKRARVRSRRRAARAIASSISPPIGSITGRPGSRMPPRWSGACWRSCGSPVSSATSTVSGCAAGSTRSATPTPPSGCSKRGGALIGGSPQRGS